MKKLILYYTFGGSTQREAQRLAQESGDPIYRVKEMRNRSLFGAFIPGGYQAMSRSKPRLQPVELKLEDFDHFIIACPVWAGYPAPAFNSIVKLLPPGKEVELIFCSAGGETPKSRIGTQALVEKQGCKVISYRDVRTGVNPGKMKETNELKS